MRITDRRGSHIHSHGVKKVLSAHLMCYLIWTKTRSYLTLLGSSLDGCEPTVAPYAYSTHPNMSITKPSVYSELFAFGSLLYEVETFY
ncbi:hypothetical protein V8C42DRAFT_311848 [Trichoderma barbatum]